MWEKKKERLLEALRCFLQGKTVGWKDGMGEADWQALFQLAMMQQVLPMVFEAVYDCPAFGALEEKAARRIRKNVIRQVTLQNRKTEEFLILYQELLRRGLEPLVVKGLICRELYRKPDHRASGDEDLLVREEEFSAFRRALRENHLMAPDPEQDREDAEEISYFRRGSVLHVELHRKLFPSGSEAYGFLNSLFEGAFERKIRQEIRGVGIWTLCPTDHLLYLILHAFKHFLHSGFGIRQVCDILLFAGKNGREVDWGYLRKQCRSIHAEVFVGTLFRMGRNYLGFCPREAGVPEEWVRRGEDEEDLLEDLLEGGVFGNASLSRRHSSNLTLAAVTVDRGGKKRRGGLSRTLFPDREYMAVHYPYVKKLPFLMPVAWISRMAKYLAEIRRCQGSSAAESLKIGNRRIALLKKYGIIE